MKSLKPSCGPSKRSLLIALLSLSSCATPTPKSDPAIVPASNPCSMVPLPDVSTATRMKLANEIDSAAPAAAWPGQWHDYVALRAAVRACQGVKP
jgi:hypothetical protein